MFLSFGRESDENVNHVLVLYVVDQLCYLMKLNRQGGIRARMSSEDRATVKKRTWSERSRDGMDESSEGGSEVSWYVCMYEVQRGLTR